MNLNESSAVANSPGVFDACSRRWNVLKMNACTAAAARAMTAATAAAAYRKDDRERSGYATPPPFELTAGRRNMPRAALTVAKHAAELYAVRLIADRHSNAHGEKTARERRSRE